jgi:hypothetical protein
MAGYGRKKTFKEKMANLRGTLKRAFILTTLAGVTIGGPAYYHYGTVKEVEVKVKDVKSEWQYYDSKKGESVYEYKIVTDRGQVLANKNTKLHFKFNSKDIQEQLNEGRSSYSYYSPWGSDDSTKSEKPKGPEAKDKIWHIKYYGARIDIPFIHTAPNILSVREVTQDELKARAEADAARRQANGQQQPGQPNNVQQPNGQQQPVQQVQPSGQLSGTMITFETVVDGQKIQMTVPIEAANKITVNKVTPLVPVAPVVPKGPGG